jgi:DNA-directed RNA polymerase specialized sigma subunit
LTYQDKNMISKFWKRNNEMYDLRKNREMTLTAIGKKYGLTRERVRVIVNKIAERNADKDIQDIRPTGNREDNSSTE